MKSLGVKVDIKIAEEIRRELKKKNILRCDLVPKKVGNFLILPIKEKIEDFEIVEDDFKTKKQKPSSYQDIANVPEHLKTYLPSSYDIIGDIILIKVPRELKRYSREIGEALLKSHKNVRAVYHAEPVEGKLRLRKLIHLAGEKRTITIYREFGVEMEVDLSKIFFSPRLSNERYRIAKLVKNGEVIIDMFAGCAPFSLIIAKHSNPGIIYAIDINKDAIELARKNVKRNKLLHKIEIIEGDSRKVIRKLLEKGIKADRIIMNLPFGAGDFLEDALSISKRGSIIHMYSVLKEKEIKSKVSDLEKEGNLKVIKINKIKTYAPREFYICFDISVIKPA